MHLCIRRIYSQTAYKEGTNKVEACASSTEGGPICEEHESSNWETILMVGGPMIVPHRCRAARCWTCADSNKSSGHQDPMHWICRLTYCEPENQTFQSLPHILPAAHHWILHLAGRPSLVSSCTSCIEPSPKTFGAFQRISNPIFIINKQIDARSKDLRNSIAQVENVQ